MIKFIPLIALFAVGCIMPPVGVKRPPIRPLDQIAPNNIMVNQLGYLPGGPKLAVYTNGGNTPTQWSLILNGKIIATGNTEVLGKDGDSGDLVQLIDFSRVTQTGEGFTLKTGNDTSLPFDIKPRLYQPLARDAIRYFYLNRSGIPLEMPYIEVKRRARAAGHLSDKAAPCDIGQRCHGKRDVWGGWYDAGDYGKYVVNGGLSVWLLLHAYQVLHPTGPQKGQSNINLNIPESDNDVPDILDESRFELEWMLKMQEGPKSEEAGMVHHRVRNANFTPLGKAPPTYNEDPPRYLRDTTTGATLNLAAVMAKASVIYRPFDAKFADRCLTAAKTAFDAAIRNPDLKTTRTGAGMIPYRDAKTDDEFFWAAAELFTATGEQRYQTRLAQSPFYKKPPQGAGGSTSLFNWADTAGLGTLTLALSETVNGTAGLHTKQVLDFADLVLSLSQKQGYRFPLMTRTYPWGSNSFVLNNAVVLCLAHQMSGDRKYLDGAIVAMGYLLGRNPVDFSYISGYGTRSLKFPHHRFFAPSYDKRLPFIPPGAVAGGPNTNLADKTVRQHRNGCPPAKCYVDDIESFSTNEVAINWNAALAFVAVYIDQVAR